MNAIATVRQLVFGLIQQWSTIPVLRWLPQDENEGPPAYVVGRPEVNEGAQRMILSVSVPVYVIGRTSTGRDNDSQAELDTAADALLNALWEPPQTETISLRLTRMQATVIPIAGIDYPAYTGTVVAGTTYC